MIAKTREIANKGELPGIVKATNSLPTIRYIDPEYVYMAVTNSRCPSAEVYVKPYKHIQGQCI